MFAWLRSDYARRELLTEQEQKPKLTSEHNIPMQTWESSRCKSVSMRRDGQQLRFISISLMEFSWASQDQTKDAAVMISSGQLEGSWHISLWTRVWRGKGRQFHFMEVTNPSGAPWMMRLRSSSLHLSTLEPSSERYSRTWRAHLLQVKKRRNRLQDEIWTTGLNSSTSPSGGRRVGVEYLARHSIKLLIGSDCFWCSTSTGRILFKMGGI